MPVREETLTFGDVVITCRQLSFAAQMRLSVKDEKSVEDIYSACVDKPELLERLTPEEGLKVVAKINELNGWDKAKDFQPTPAASGS